MPAVAGFPAVATTGGGYTPIHASPGAAIGIPAEGVWGVVYLNTDRDQFGALIVPESLPSTTMEGFGTTRYAAHTLAIPSRDGIYLQIHLNGIHPARITLALTVGNKTANISSVEYTQLDLIVPGRMVTLMSKGSRWHLGNYAT